MHPETKFKLRVMEDLKILPKAWFFKTQMLATLGIPDIIGVINGRFIALELKKNKQEVRKSRTKIQKYVLGKIAEAGGYASMLYPENKEQVMRDLIYISAAYGEGPVEVI